MRSARCSTSATPRNDRTDPRRHPRQRVGALAGRTRRGPARGPGRARHRDAPPATATARARSTPSAGTASSSRRCRRRSGGATPTSRCTRPRTSRRSHRTISSSAPSPSGPMPATPSSGPTLAGLPEAATVGTGSVRRRAQLAALRPDLRFAELRGNVPTRVERASEFDAVVIAAAALARLELADRATEVLPIEVMLPMVGQGALAVECRADDTATAERLAAIDDARAHRALDAERGLPRRARRRVHDALRRLRGRDRRRRALRRGAARGRRRLAGAAHHPYRHRRSRRWDAPRPATSSTTSAAPPSWPRRPRHDRVPWSAPDAVAPTSSPGPSPLARRPRDDRVPGRRRTP